MCRVSFLIPRDRPKDTQNIEKSNTRKWRESKIELYVTRTTEEWPTTLTLSQIKVCESFPFQ